MATLSLSCLPREGGGARLRSPLSCLPREGGGARLRSPISCLPREGGGARLRRRELRLTHSPSVSVADSSLAEGAKTRTGGVQGRLRGCNGRYDAQSINAHRQCGWCKMSISRFAVFFTHSPSVSVADSSLAEGAKGGMPVELPVELFEEVQEYLRRLRARRGILWHQHAIVGTVYYALRHSPR